MCSHSKVVKYPNTNKLTFGLISRVGSLSVICKLLQSFEKTQPSDVVSVSLRDGQAHTGVFFTGSTHCHPHHFWISRACWCKSFLLVTSYRRLYTGENISPSWSVPVTEVWWGPCENVSFLVPVVWEHTASGSDLMAAMFKCCLKLYACYCRKCDWWKKA